MTASGSVTLIGNCYEYIQGTELDTQHYGGRRMANQLACPSASLFPPAYVVQLPVTTYLVRVSALLLLMRVDAILSRT